MSYVRKTETVSGIQCPQCKEKLWSRHRHDFRYCKCKYCFIDGGRDYVRSGYGGEKWPRPWQSPARVTLRVKKQDIQPEPRWPY